MPTLPTDGMVFHIDADSITGLADGSLVSSWADLSVNGYNVTQSSDSYKPTYVASGINGKPVVRFSGGQYLDGGDVLDMGTNDFQIISVIKANTTATLKYWISKSIANAANYRYGTSVHTDGTTYPFIQGNGGSDVWPVSTFRVDDGKPHLINFQLDRDANTTTTIDGQYNTKAAISQWNGLDFQSTFPFRIGSYTQANGVTPNNFFYGDIAEVIIYNRKLTEDERYAVEFYLGSKWLNWSNTKIYDNLIETAEFVEMDSMGAGSASYDGLVDGAHVDRYVRTTSAVVPNSTSFTLEFWIYRTGSHRWNSGVISTGVVAGVFNNFGGTTSYIGFGATWMEYYLNFNGSLLYRNPSLPYSISNAWHHMALTYDGTDLICYINGVPFYTDNRPGYLRTGSSVMSIGYFTTYWLHGQVSDLRVWSVTRTQSEIQRDMKKRLIGNENGLIFYMPLNDASGTTAKELVSGNDGTLTNVTWSGNTPPIPTVQITSDYKILASEFVESDTETNPFRILTDKVQSRRLKEHYQPSIVTDGLVLWLEGEDFTNVPQTITWRDRSGRGNHATANSFAYTTSSGSQGDGWVMFDGTGDYLLIKDNAAMEPTEATFEFRFNNKNNSGYKSLICKRASTATDGYFFFLATSTGEIQSDWGGNATRWSTGYIVPLNTDITVTLTCKNGLRRLYINGQYQTQSATGESAKVPGTSDIYISRNSVNPDYYLNMELKYVRMYNRILTDAEILSNYNASLN